MNAFKKVCSIAFTVIVILMVLCAVVLMGSRLVGYQPYTVISPSMQPAYKVDDLIFVKQVYRKNLAEIKDPAELEVAKKEKIAAVNKLIDEGKLAVGDVITYVADEKLTLCTHRIVEIDKENNAVFTKGDANDTWDAAVSYLNIVGEVQFSVSKVGKVSNYVQTPPGSFVTLGVGIFLILLVFLTDILGKKKEEENETQAEAEDVTAVAEENERLKAELEKLRSEMEKKDS